jgi:peptidoglycan-N-acetylglucosamine deacetylase
MKRAFLTTSWDDGHAFDATLAERLAFHGVPATFYVPLSYPKLPGLAKDQIRRLASMGMEIGSHTISHSRLTKLADPAVWQELTQSKAILEDLAGAPIKAFCYPEGKFNRRTTCAVREAGFLLGRTTVAFQAKTDFDPFRMPVSFQFYPHSRNVHIRHALKENNLSGLANWSRFWRCETDLIRLSERMLDYVAEQGGVFHMWGHSWEIAECGLWNQLEQVLKLAGSCPGVEKCTNAELIEQYQPCLSA